MLAAILGLAPGCTLFDDYLPGTPFTPDQPAAEVTVQGGINSDRTAGGAESCTPGGTVFWGTARNTGDVDVDEVFITINAFDAAGNVLGSYRTNVFSGTITEGTAVGASASVSTSLLVDQSGVFEVCTSLPFGSVARTDYHTDFLVIQPVTAQ